MTIINIELKPTLVDQVRAQFQGHILVIEDEAVVRRQLSHWLTAAGYQVMEAASAVDASRIASTHPVAVAVCDVNLGAGENGLDLTASLLRSRPEMTVIFATGLDSLPASATLQPGVVRYLMKPIVYAQLMQAVAEGVAEYTKNFESLDAARSHRYTVEEAKAELVRDLMHLPGPEALVQRILQSERMRVHAEAVARLAVGMSAWLGCGPSEIERIRLLALVHEVGKLVLPPGLLRETRPLTVFERQMLRSYVKLGGEILDSAEYPELAALVGALGEHWNGFGYPAGLSGATIPLESRIVAVADAFDTIARSRTYGPAPRFGSAIVEVMRVSGSQFDPRAVEALLECQYLYDDCI